LAAGRGVDTETLSDLSDDDIDRLIKEALAESAAKGSDKSILDDIPGISELLAQMEAILMADPPEVSPKKPEGATEPMKLVVFQGKSWWVPEENSISLAVQLQDPEDYQEYCRAINDKLLDLIAKAGPFPEVLAKVRWAMEPQGVAIEETNDPEQLVEQILATASVGEMVRSGAPGLAKPASKEEAQEAVEAQEALELLDFLS
jgi:hypothetical protein